MITRRIPSQLCAHIPAGVKVLVFLPVLRKHTANCTGGYIDFQNDIKVGVNGIVIKNALLSQDNQITITLSSQLAELKNPWQSPYVTDLFLTGLRSGEFNVVVNDAKGKRYNTEQLRNLHIKVYPDGRIEII